MGGAALAETTTEHGLQPGIPPTGTEVGQAPVLRLVVRLPWEEERDRALQFARGDYQEGEIPIDPDSLTPGGIATAVVKIVRQDRVSEESKPPGERDLDRIEELRDQTDRLLNRLPSWSLKSEVTLLAHNL